MGKTKWIVAFFAVSLIVVSPCYAQEWAKTFGGTSDDSASCVRQTKDKGYIIAGSAWSFGPGRTWVIKLDNKGKSLWQKTYGDDHYGAAVIEQTADEGYILSGSSSSHDSNGDMWLMKLNTEVTIDWQKSYGGAGADVATSVQQTSDGGYIVAGNTQSFGAGERADLWLLKVDADGNVGETYPETWQKTYGTAEGGEWGTPASVRQIEGGGYIVAAATYSFGAGGLDFWLLKVDADGNVGETYPGTWQKTYGGDDMDIPYSIQRAGDGGYIVVGKSLSFDPGGTSWDAWVIKLSASGGITWQRVYDLGRDEAATAVLQRKDGSYIVAGNTSASSPDLSDGWIMNLGPMGNILWRKIYGGPELSRLDHLASIDQTSDDEFVAVGYTNSFSFGDRNAWVLKLGAKGQIDGCPAVKTGGTLSDITSITETGTSVTASATTITPNVTAATANETKAHEGDGCVMIPGFVNLPKTGQTTSYSAGDDGDLRPGVTWPSPRFRDNGNGTVTDRLTGLMWLKDANCAHTIGYDPDAAGDGTMDWASAFDFIAGINEGGLDISPCASYSAAHTDWRMANINELESVVNLEVADQSAWLNAQGFSNVQLGYYWSSTTTPGNGNGAIYLDMQGGYVREDFKTYYLYVWPVRAGQRSYPDSSFPANVWQTGQTTPFHAGDDGSLQMGVAWPEPRFSDHGDGTVTDNLTGLMWLKDGTCFGLMYWSEALDTVGAFNSVPDSYGCEDYIEDYHDWRMPNRKEILSLISRSYGSPGLPVGHPFVNIYEHYYIWSSTTYADVNHYAWYFGMRFGTMYSGPKATYQYEVLPVRGGKHGSAFPANITGALFILLLD